jgi:hypothetical protein
MGWWLGGGTALGTIGLSWQQLDDREFGLSLIASTIGLAVIAAGAITFVVTRRRGYEPPKTLALTGTTLLVVGLPVLFLLAAATVI